MWRAGRSGAVDRSHAQRFTENDTQAGEVKTMEIPFPPIMSLLSLQFVVLGWRVQREITLMEQGRATWFLLEDYGVLVSLLLVLVGCIVYPLGFQGTTADIP